MHALRSTLLALLMLAATGCAPQLMRLDDLLPFGPPPPAPRITVYRSRLLPNATRLRVLVLPFRHLDPDAARAVTEAFAVELQKTQMFEVLSPYGPAAAVLDEVRVWPEDGLDVRGLIALRRRLRVDAVVLGHVLEYRPYDPQVLAVRLQVVSTRTGGVLGGAEGCFDAREAGVQGALRAFYERHLDGPERPGHWRTILVSPWHYAQFVAHALVAALGQSRLAAAPPPDCPLPIAPLPKVSHLREGTPQRTLRAEAMAQVPSRRCYSRKPFGREDARKV